MIARNARPRPRARSRDALSIYLREIENIPVLDRDEEQRCARKARRGDATAFQKLIRHNLRFVVRVAHEYQRSGFPLEDLINEGNLGLVQAAQRFDPRRGCRFISYASWWIRRGILAYLTDRSRIVRIPADRVYERMQLARISADLEQRLERQPTQAELARAMKRRESDIEFLQGLPVVSLSIDAPAQGEDADFEVETLEDGGSDSDAQYAVRERASAVRKAIEILDARERDVVQRHYGLLNDEPETLQRIGTDWGVTRERARQLKGRAIEKIRRSRRAAVLREYTS